MSALPSTSPKAEQEPQRRMYGRNSFTDKRFSLVLRATRLEQVPQARAGGVNAVNVRHCILPWRNINDAIGQQMFKGASNVRE
jgi:hypothetical protein